MLRCWQCALLNAARKRGRWTRISRRLRLVALQTRGHRSIKTCSPDIPRGRYFTWYGCGACLASGAKGVLALGDTAWRHGGGLDQVYRFIAQAILVRCRAMASVFRPNRFGRSRPIFLICPNFRPTNAVGRITPNRRSRRAQLAQKLSGEAYGAADPRLPAARWMRRHPDATQSGGQPLWAARVDAGDLWHRLTAGDRLPGVGVWRARGPGDLGAAPEVEPADRGPSLWPLIAALAVTGMFVASIFTP